MRKTAITLTGTAHDEEGKINIEHMCDGLHIEKRDRYTNGKIVLTREELRDILRFAEENFSFRSENQINVGEMTEEEQAEEAQKRG